MTSEIIALSKYLNKYLAHILFHNHGAILVKLLIMQACSVVKTLYARTQ